MLFFKGRPPSRSAARCRACAGAGQFALLPTRAAPGPSYAAHAPSQGRGREMHLYQIKYRTLPKHAVHRVWPPPPLHGDLDLHRGAVDGRDVGVEGARGERAEAARLLEQALVLLGHAHLVGVFLFGGVWLNRPARASARTARGGCGLSGRGGDSRSRSSASRKTFSTSAALALAFAEASGRS